MNDDLHHAVAELTAPKHIRVHHDGHGYQWLTTPSLWDQLAEATRASTETTNGRSSTTRLPIDPELLDLRSEIITCTTHTLHAYGLRPRPDLPASLRLLAASAIGDLADALTQDVRHWTHRARRALGLAGPLPRRIRGASCPDCGTTRTQITTTDGDTQHAPSLLIDFTDGLVRAVTCTACGATWFRGTDLIELADTLTDASTCTTSESNVSS